jgi:hypothetical protein
MRPTILRNEVDDVVDAISGIEPSFSVAPESIEKAKEQLRVLNVRVPMGKLGKGDQGKGRAAVVLDYILLKVGTQRLPIKKLAQAAGLKVPAMEQLQRLAGNYLQNQYQAPGAKRGLEREDTLSPASLAKCRTARTTRPDCVDHGEWASTIPDLAIRLAAYVVDPYGSVKEATSLLQDIKNYIGSLSIYERRGYLYDMNRYRAAYEAAAFFFVAQRDAKAFQRNGPSKKGGEDDEYVSFDLQDLLTASNKFTFLELKQVLPHVQQLAQTLEQKRTEASSGTKKISDKYPNKFKRASKKIKADHEEDLEQNAKARAMVEAELVSGDKAEVFEEWKKKVLESACESVRKEAGDTGVPELSILAQAADAALARHGISIPETHEQ